MRKMTRAEFDQKLSWDYAGYNMTTGKPQALGMDPKTGATILEPVEIIEPEPKSTPQEAPNA